MNNGINENVTPKSKPKPLQIKQDDKFFSRLMSKETEPSFRVLYYGGAAGSIPFTWESCPGTPKHQFSDSYVQPLTPPPSYQLNRSRSKITRRANSSGKFSFLGSIRDLRSLSKSDDGKTASISSSSHSSSSNASWPSTPTKKHGGRKGNWMVRSISAVRSGDRRQEDGDYSPTSTLCFGGAGGDSSNGSGHTIKSVMKRAFFSVGRHGMA